MNYDRLLFRIYRARRNYLLRSIDKFIVLNNTPYFMGLDDCSGNVNIQSYILNEYILRKNEDQYYYKMLSLKIKKQPDGNFLIEDMYFDSEGRLIKTSTGVRFFYTFNSSIISACSHATNDLVLDTDGSVIKFGKTSFIYNYNSNNKRLISIIDKNNQFSENYYYDKNNKLIMIKSGTHNYNRVEYGE